METASATAIDLITDPGRAGLVVDPLRRRLLEELRDRPDSASGLARRLGTSRQRLQYHLTALEEAGFVELTEERKRGNCVERVLRVTAGRLLVDPAILGAEAAEPGALQDRFSATYLLALAARAIREIAGVRERARRQRKRLATVAVDADVRLGSPADFDAFARDLAAAVARVVAKHHDERASDGRRFRVMAAAWPGPRKDSHSSSDTGRSR
jgi:DNA-binding transcriptional ArsR family regulator